MNVKLLRKVKKHILAEPKRLYMSEYIKRKEYDEICRPFPKCGTAACIAGWTCIFDLGDADKALATDEHTHAARLLGLDNQEAFRLFIPTSWPVKFMDGATDDGKAATAKVAAARIEHFIKTKGAE